MSVTVISTFSPVGCTSTRIEPPAGVWRIALETTLAMALRMRAGSTSTFGTVEAMAEAMLTPNASLCVSNEASTSWTRAPGSTCSRFSTRLPASVSTNVRRSSTRTSSVRVASRIGWTWSASPG